METITILKLLCSSLNKMRQRADPCPIEILNFSTLLESSLMHFLSPCWQFLIAS